MEFFLVLTCIEQSRWSTRGLVWLIQKEPSSLDGIVIDNVLLAVVLHIGEEGRKGMKRVEREPFVSLRVRYLLIKI